MVIEGKVSSTLQVTIPARVSDALGIEPGDAPRFELEAGSVRPRVVRPAIEDSLEAVWAKHDLGDLREAMGGDAGADGPVLALFVGWAELMAVRQPAALLGFLAMVQISVVWTMPAGRVGARWCGRAVSLRQRSLYRRGRCLRLGPLPQPCVLGPVACPPVVRRCGAGARFARCTRVPSG